MLLGGGERATLLCSHEGCWAMQVEGVKRDPDTGEISYELNTGDIPSMAFA